MILAAKVRFRVQPQSDGCFHSEVAGKVNLLATNVRSVDGNYLLSSLLSYEA